MLFLLPWLLLLGVLAADGQSTSAAGAAATEDVVGQYLRKRFSVVQSLHRGDHALAEPQPGLSPRIEGIGSQPATPPLGQSRRTY
jgi:hypothetical protein